MDNNTNKPNALERVNQVEGFDPKDYATNTPNDLGATSVYLDAKVRTAWFWLKHPTGHIVKHLVSYTETVAVVEVRLYTDREDLEKSYLANGFAQRFLEPNCSYGDRFLESAETAALARALSAAGFNLAGEQSGESSFSDVPLTLAQTVDESVPPTEVSTPPPTVVSQQKQPQQQTLQQILPPITVEEFMTGMTLEEAKNCKVSFKGSHNGKTLAQMALEDMRDVEWIATTYSGKDLKLVAAARVLIAAAQQQMAG